MIDRPDTLKLVFEIAAASYKEQTDLDESVWRTMPFIAALFALAVSVIRFIPPHFSFNEAFLISFASLLYVAAIIMFTGAFAYVWMALKPREFEIPAKSLQIRDYAHSLINWHVSAVTEESQIDTKVTSEVRLFMIDQLCNANETNFVLIQKRLAARSRTILLMLTGFALISLSEVILFVNEAI